MTRRYIAPVLALSLLLFSAFDAFAACSIVASRSRTAVMLSDTSQSLEGTLCVAGSCQPISGKTGIITTEIYARAGDLITFSGLDEVSKGVKTPVRCSMSYSETRSDKIPFEGLLTAIGGLLTCLLAAWLPSWFASRRERETAIVVWLDEYRERIRAFVANPGEDISPKPLPALDLDGSKKLIRLRENVRRITQNLSASSNDDERTAALKSIDKLYSSLFSHYRFE